MITNDGETKLEEVLDLYAIVETGGKQYMVKENDIIHVEKLEANEGDEISLENVLFVSNDGDNKVGKPYVEGAKVTCKVLKQGKSKKIIVFKYKPKKNERKKKGHRQPFTRLEVTKIEA